MTWTATRDNPPVIVCRDNAAEPVLYARNELRRYLGHILSADIDAVAETPAGAQPIIRLAVGALDDRSDDAYTIEADGPVLYIRGGSPLGLVFGVFGFLRKVCGCRFSGLGPDSEHVPSLDRIEFAAEPIRRAPLVWYRALQFSGFESDEMLNWRLDWMVRNGLNYVMVLVTPEGKSAERIIYDPKTGEPLNTAGRKRIPLTLTWFEEHLMPMLRRRGLKADMNHHNLLFWLPPERYMADHPEWYALRDGERGASLNQLCICTSNEEAVRTLTENIKAFLRTHPDLRIVGVIPEDGNCVCECEQCVALDVHPGELNLPPGETRDPAMEDRNLANRYALLLNHVARAVATEFPDILIGGAAYVDLQWPPRDVVLEPNIITWVALYWRDGARPIVPEARSAYSRFYHDLLSQWQEAFAGHLTVYTYYMGMYAQRNLPYPQAEVICQEWPALRALGVEGATCQVEGANHQAYGLNHLAFARCGWEANVVAADVLDEFLVGMFGAAAESVRPLYAGLLRAMEELAAIPADTDAGPRGIPGAALQPDSQNAVYFLESVGLDVIHNALQQAQAAAGTDREARQVERLARYVGYWEMAADIWQGVWRAEDLRDDAPAQAAAVRRELVERRIPELVALVRESPADGWLCRATMLNWERQAEKLGQVVRHELPRL